MTCEIRLPEKPEAQADREQNVADDVKEIIELASAFAFEKFRARNLAVASVQDTEDLKEQETPEKGPIGSLEQNEPCDDRNRKNQEGPSVWSCGESEEKASHPTRDWAIQISGDETILGFAAFAQKSCLDLVDLTAISDIFPGSSPEKKRCLHLVEMSVPALFLLL